VKVINQRRPRASCWIIKLAQPQPKYECEFEFPSPLSPLSSTLPLIHVLFLLFVLGGHIAYLCFRRSRGRFNCHSQSERSGRKWKGKPTQRERERDRDRQREREKERESCVCVCWECRIEMCAVCVYSA